MEVAIFREDRVHTVLEADRRYLSIEHVVPGCVAIDHDLLEDRPVPSARSQQPCTTTPQEPTQRREGVLEAGGVVEQHWVGHEADELPHDEDRDAPRPPTRRDIAKRRESGLVLTSLSAVRVDQDVRVDRDHAISRSGP